MKLKKITALILSVAMAAVILTGCGQTQKSPFVSDSAATDAAPSAAASSAVLNVAGAYASVDPKTAMLTVNGKEVTWGDFFYLINSAVNELQGQGVTVTDWNAAYADGQTYKDYILDRAVKAGSQNAAVEYGASETKVVLSDEDKAAIQAEWDKQVQGAGSEEALIGKLKEQYVTKELYQSLTNISYLAQACFNEMYGSDGNKLPDQEVADYTAADGYLMAKHILIMTVKTDESGNQTPMTADEKAQAKAKAEDILKQLKAYSGKDFAGFFDELMNKNSEDKGGLASYPNGYLFQSGEMVKPFEDATKALEIGKISDLVETDYGYHIIYRLPIDYNATPMAYSNYGPYSLRYITATNMFKAIVETWTQNVKVEYSDAFKALDFNKIFAA